MVLRYNKDKLVQETVKGYDRLGKGGDKLFKESIISSLFEISQRVAAIERVLAKKKVLHSKEINTELQKVQKRIIKKYNKLKKEFKNK